MSRLTLADFGDQEANGNAETEEKKCLKKSLDIVDTTLLETVPGGRTATGERTDDPDFDDDELAERKHSRDFARVQTRRWHWLLCTQRASNSPLSQKSADDVMPFSFA